MHGRWLIQTVSVSVGKKVYSTYSTKVPLSIRIWRYMYTDSMRYEVLFYNFKSSWLFCILYNSSLGFHRSDSVPFSRSCLYKVSDQNNSSCFLQEYFYSALLAVDKQNFSIAPPSLSPPSSHSKKIFKKVFFYLHAVRKWLVRLVIDTVSAYLLLTARTRFRCHRWLCRQGVDIYSHWLRGHGDDMVVDYLDTTMTSIHRHQR